MWRNENINQKRNKNIFSIINIAILFLLLPPWLIYYLLWPVTDHYSFYMSMQFFSFIIIFHFTTYATFQHSTSFFTFNVSSIQLMPPYQLFSCYFNPSSTAFLDLYRPPFFPTPFELHCRLRLVNPLLITLFTAFLVSDAKNCRKK